MSKLQYREMSDMTDSDIDKFLSESDSRETSIQIMQAITMLATSYTDAVDIWENGNQLHHIVEIVTQNGQVDSGEFTWGDSGRYWA